MRVDVDLADVHAIIGRSSMSDVLHCSALCITPLILSLPIATALPDFLLVSPWLRVLSTLDDALLPPKKEKRKGCGCVSVW